MTETLLGLLSSFGPWVILICAYFSCLFIPIPTSLIMLAGGAFVASGDLLAWQVIVPAFVGAILGDQTGFHIGRANTGVLARLSQNNPARKKALASGQKLIARRGAWGVFFSTWLVAPLGPWVNVIAGAAGLNWARFTLADVLGEAIWVSAYVGLGYVFADRLSDLSYVLSNLIGFLTALALTAGLGYALVQKVKAAKNKAAA